MSVPRSLEPISLACSVSSAGAESGAPPICMPLMPPPPPPPICARAGLALASSAITHSVNLRILGSPLNSVSVVPALVSGPGVVAIPKMYHRIAGAAQATGVNNGAPAKCAFRLATSKAPIASRVSVVWLP